MTSPEPLGSSLLPHVQVIDGHAMLARHTAAGDCLLPTGISVATNAHLFDITADYC
jgi:hypothetical protein